MPYSLDVDQLRTFLAIAELGGFSKAGEAVHKTQSAVSMQMRRLEERLGQTLFAKDGRNSRLTDDGHRLVDYARRMIALNDETVVAFAKDKEIAGQVRLGLPDDYAERLLPQVLAAFGRINPSTQLEVFCESSMDLGVKIRRGELDLAIVTGSDCTDVPGTIIRREQLHWVGPQDVVLHDKDPMPIAVGPITCSWRNKAISAMEKTQRPYQVVFSSASAAALSGAVQAGLAIAVLPASAIRSVHRILGEKEGMPPLGPCDISLLKSISATENVHQALIQHIISSIGNVSFDVAAE
ncbi:LysR substrate-binding domain-containing protein [Polycladidibacter hongkongensis]|uniref:LysR substrate-binding domain-containing protein n=1 Tax=Polycladidibacter hongkongensis TaxID=1647556 RepID=UPI000830E8E5|nr:LysR substrate-binding domain-containing protein [Pseudovibrio hongkongensis]